jgi:hypothetical protein
MSRRDRLGGVVHEYVLADDLSAPYTLDSGKRPETKAKIGEQVHNPVSNRERRIDRRRLFCQSVAPSGQNRGLNMLCLEVAVNGERYCLAGADDVWVVYAKVASPWPILQRFFGSGFDLSVRGWRDGNTFREAMGPYWGEWVRHLNVGDVVTIRLVESNVPDSPRYCKSSASVDGVVAKPELFAYSTRIPDGLAGFLFWMGVAMVGIVLLYVTPHG